MACCAIFYQSPESDRPVLKRYFSFKAEELIYYRQEAAIMIKERIPISGGSKVRRVYYLNRELKGWTGAVSWYAPHWMRLRLPTIWPVAKSILSE
mgnify:CR=1 FL=1